MKGIAVSAAAAMLSFCTLRAQETAFEPEVQHQPAMKTVRCEICSGKGSLVIEPPAQLAAQAASGAMGTARSRGTKCRCPVCQGKGSRRVREVRDEAPRDVTPCPSCGWNGFTRCAKCGATGLVECKAKNCDGGWVFTKRVKSANGQMKGPVLEPCRTCQGVGRTLCKACLGERSTLCRKCHGLGEKPERNKSR